MRIGKILRGVEVSNGVTELKVSHGGLYHPLGFNQSQRQYDYRVLCAHGNRIIRLAVECKNFFPGSPVVVCGAPRAASESRLDLVVSDVRMVVEHGRGQQKRMGIGQISSPSALYPVGGFVGKSIVRPDPTASKEKEVVKGSGYRLTGDGDIWERWNQSVSHAAVLAEIATTESKRLGTLTFTSILPVVVVPEDCLWTITYNEDGTIEGDPVKVSVASLFIGSNHTVGDFASIQLSHIHLMTPKGLGDFVAGLGDVSGPLWKEIFSDSVLSAYTGTRTASLYV